MGMLRPRAVTCKSGHLNENPSFRVLEGVYGDLKPRLSIQKVRTIVHVSICIYKYKNYQIYLHLTEITSPECVHPILYFTSDNNQGLSELYKVNKSIYQNNQQFSGLTKLGNEQSNDQV